MKVAVFSFDGNKAPRPNDFSMFFFQLLWHIVENNIVRGVKEFFSAMNILKELNATFLVLIPKILGDDSMDNFRPISLCNSFIRSSLKCLHLEFWCFSPRSSPLNKIVVLGWQILDLNITVHENIQSLEVS